MQFSNIIQHVSITKFSPNSQYFACCQSSSKIIIRQASLKNTIISIINVPGAATDCMFSYNSQNIAVFIQKKSMVVIYTIEGNMIAKIQDTQANILGMLWVFDSVQIITFSQYLLKCSIYNLSNQTITYIKGPKLSTNKGCIFSKDGKFMGLLQRHDVKDYLGIYFTVDWKMVNSILLQLFDAVQIKWSPDNSHIIAIDNCINYKLLIICPLKGIIHKYQPYQYALGIKCIQYSQKNKLLSIGSYDQKIRILNTLTWKLISQLDCSQININSNQLNIYKQDDLNKIKLVDSNIYKIPTIKIIHTQKGINQGVSCVQFSYNDQYLACQNDNMPYTIWIWQMSRLQLKTIISLSTHIKMFKWQKNSNALCIVSGTDRLLYWKQDNLIQFRLPNQNRKFNIQRVKWSNNPKKMLLYDKTDILYAQMHTQQI